MASGTGWDGGRSGCFTYWQKFQKCYIVSDSPSQQCGGAVEDYLECLHHVKANKRADQIREQLTRQLAHDLKEKGKQNEILSGGGQASVGIIGKTNS